jgi:hypothetical protein
MAPVNQAVAGHPSGNRTCVISPYDLERYDEPRGIVGETLLVKELADVLRSPPVSWTDGGGSPAESVARNLREEPTLGSDDQQRSRGEFPCT